MPPLLPGNLKRSTTSLYFLSCVDVCDDVVHISGDVLFCVGRIVMWVGCGVCIVVWDTVDTFNAQRSTHLAFV